MPDSTAPAPEPEKRKKRNRKKQERKFLDTDADYCAHSRVKHKHFTEALAAFTAFDPTLDATFATNWFAKIEACEALYPDDAFLNRLAGIKEKRDKAVDALIIKINQVEIFALEAFKTEPETLYEFQFNKINQPYQYSLNFIINVYVMKMLADEEYNAELLAAGMPPNLLPDLDVALESVTSYEIYHEKFKRMRLRFTRLRIKEMNQLFDITEKIRKVALAIFADKPEVATLFG